MNKRCNNKLITIILTAALMLSLGAAAAAATDGVQVTPTASTVRINGSPVAFEAYTINGNNYFRLRDLAMVFMGSAKKFSLEWDDTEKAIRVLSNSRYNPIGGELTVTNKTTPVTAELATSKILLDGKQIYANAYVINSTNYFKLRDIGAAMNFSVTYDLGTKDIMIDTNKGYYLSAVMEIIPQASYNMAAGIIFYNRTESGSITITEHSRTYFDITGVGLASDNDLAKLKDIISVFVSNPDQVMGAVNSSKSGGQQVLQIDGKSFICTSVGQTITIIVSW